MIQYLIINKLRGNDMSYIITAEVSLTAEENMGGRVELVEARILSRTPYRILFDIKGNFHKDKELTLDLCKSLINAGFISFDISHSY